jgi:hypothetical protein
MEESGVKDLSTGFPIRVSITVRKFYRKTLPETYGPMRNANLNKEIANDFNHQSSKILHYFPLSKKGPREIGEIRGSGNMYYISAIRNGFIDVLAIKEGWLKVKKPIKHHSKLVL